MHRAKVGLNSAFFLLLLFFPILHIQGGIYICITGLCCEGCIVESLKTQKPIRDMREYATT